MADKFTDPQGNITIGVGVEIRGSIKVPGHAYVDGSFEGELSAKALVVGHSGKVSGQINVETAEISGEVHKDLKVRSKLSLRSTGNITGSATYSTIMIEEGGEISGTVQKISQAKAEPARPMQADKESSSNNTGALAARPYGAVSEIMQRNLTKTAN